MKYTIIIIYISLMLFANATLSQSLHLQCIQVNDSADAVLFWNAINIPDTYQFKIYTALNINGPYQLIDSTNITKSTYIHKNAKANLQQNFYYIQAQSIDSNKTLPTYTSDTSQNIRLIIDNQTTGIAFLHWHYPIKFSINDSFLITRSTNNIWEVIGKIPLTTFNDTITFCEKKAYYQVYYNNGGNCDYISNQAHDFLTDLTPPATARLDTVSINLANGKTELGWERSTSKDAYAYIIYLKDDIWITIDTLYGAETTFYCDEIHSANYLPQQYCIATLDTCLNASPLGEAHNTLLLISTTFKCDSIIRLQWNNYLNMPNEVDSFRIYAAANNDDFKQIASVKRNVLTYDYKHADINNNYKFYVQAYNQSNKYTSTSNIVYVSFTKTISDGSVLMRYVTVKEDNHLEIAAYINDSILFNNVILYKSVDSGKTFTYFDKQAKLTEKETYLFSDHQVNIHTNIYYYFFKLTDECDIEHVSSDTANNIVLREVESDFQSNSIIWNEYKGFPNNLDAYDIYRKTQIQSQFSLISSKLDETLNYSESIFNLAEEGNTFYYKIIAVPNNQFMFADESISNLLKIHKKDTLYIPNAFFPKSEIEVNQIFKPVCIFVDADSFEFHIYNRWGSKIFSTTNIEQGWDGTYKGKDAPQGVYTYYIQYKVSDYHTRIAKGTFVLLR